MKSANVLLAVVLAGSAGATGWYFGRAADAPAAAGVVSTQAGNAPAGGRTAGVAGVASAVGSGAAPAPNAGTPKAPGAAAAGRETPDEAAQAAADEGAQALMALAKKARAAAGGGGKWEDQLPQFVDPPMGVRAPAQTLAGLRVGFSTLEETRRHFEGLGFACRNASVRAMMGQMREKKAAEIAKVKAEGGDADGVSGASWMNYQTKHEKNPQVRLTCDPVDVAKLPDRKRPSAQGRVLALFDSDQLPLRRLVINRGHKDAAAARADLSASIDAHALVYGAPHKAIGAVPADGEIFKPYALVRRDWAFADLEVRVSTLDLGRGPRVTEEVGVPWPVRSDAPALAKAGR